MGVSPEDLENSEITLSEGSVIVEIDGPASVLSHIKDKPLEDVQVHGHRPTLNMHPDLKHPTRSGQAVVFLATPAGTFQGYVKGVGDTLKKGDVLAHILLPNETLRE